MNVNGVMNIRWNSSLKMVRKVQQKYKEDWLVILQKSNKQNNNPLMYWPYQSDIMITKVQVEFGSTLTVLPLHHLDVKEGQRYVWDVYFSPFTFKPKEGPFIS